MNFALQKPTSQSSNDGDGKSQRAVDGDTNGRFSHKSCTEIGRPDPWFRVDLRAMISVTSVSLYFLLDDDGSDGNNDDA